MIFIPSKFVFSHIVDKKKKNHIWYRDSSLFRTHFRNTKSVLFVLRFFQSMRFSFLQCNVRLEIAGDDNWLADRWKGCSMWEGSRWARWNQIWMFLFQAYSSTHFNLDICWIWKLYFSFGTVFFSTFVHGCMDCVWFTDIVCDFFHRKLEKRNSDMITGAF